MLTFLSRLLAALSTLLSVFILAVVGYQYYYAQASLDWPGTPGELRDYVDSYERDHRTRMGDRVEVVHERRVYYRYTVSGVQYLGSRISFRWSGHELPNAATGAPVTVYYNPRRPSQSVLFRESGEIPWGLIVLSFALFGLGFVILRVAAKRARSRHEH